VQPHGQTLLQVSLQCFGVCASSGRQLSSSVVVKVYQLLFGCKVVVHSRKEKKALEGVVSRTTLFEE